MKLLVLGASGILGGVLVPLCSELRLDVLAPSHRELDVTNREALEKYLIKHRLTHVINCAAYTNVDEAERDEKAAYLVNAQGPDCLGRAARELGVKVVHLSTDYVFDGTSSLPYTETDACSPINVYGKSKWEGEKALLQELPGACVLRCSWLFAKRGKNFISSLLNLMCEKEEIRVVSNQRGRATFCRDVSQACLALLDESGIFHFANSGEVSRYEMAQEVFRWAQKSGLPLTCKRVVEAHPDEFPTRAKRPLYSVLATDKIEKLIPIRPWYKALEECLNG